MWLVCVFSTAGCHLDCPFFTVQTGWNGICQQPDASQSVFLLQIICTVYGLMVWINCYILTVHIRWPQLEDLPNLFECHIWEFVPQSRASRTAYSSDCSCSFLSMFSLFDVIPFTQAVLNTSVFMVFMDSMSHNILNIFRNYLSFSRDHSELTIDLSTVQIPRTMIIKSPLSRTWILMLVLD